MNRFDTHNRNGEKICDSVGCRKHKRLTSVHGGFFCKIHRRELDEIRMNIQFFKSRLIRHEIEWRTREFLFRKTLDPGHMDYLLYLENRL